MSFLSKVFGRFKDSPEDHHQSEPDYEGNPQRYELDHPEHRARRENVALWRVCFLEALVIVILGAVIVAQYPLIRYIPVAFLWNSEEKILKKVEFLTEEVRGVEMARESFVRRYVLEREKVNLLDDQERWDWVRAYSDSLVWNPFMAKMLPLWEGLETRGINWGIHINASWRPQDSPNKWTVEFEKTVVEVGEIKERAVWLAQVTLGQLSKKATKPELMDNPFQFYVVSYSVEQKADVAERKTK